VIACKKLGKLGFKYIGIELEKEYVDIAINRLKAIKIGKLNKFMKKR
jgi:DNA modification methylase